MRRLRQARGFGIRELARLAGTSKRSVQDWETGRHAPSGEALDRVLKALDAPEGLRARLLAQAAPAYARAQLAHTSLGAPVDVGQILRAMRLRQGTTQAEVARAVEVSQATLARWEAGESTPSAEALHRVLFALEASADEALALMSAERREPAEGDLGDAFRRIHRAADAPLALRDVLLLGIESELWWLAAHDPAAESALCLVVAARAHQSLMRGALEDLDGTVRRALRLTRSAGDAAPAAAAVFAGCWVRQRRPGGAAGAARSLGKWSGRMGDPRLRAWLRAAQGTAMVRAGEPDCGIGILEEVVHATRDEPWAANGFFLEDLAEGLILADRPQEAAELHATMGGAGGPPLVARLHLARGEEPPAEAVAAMRAEPVRNWPHERYVAGIERGLDLVRRGGKARFV